MATHVAPSFIVGADRSGTTLLRLIVNEHPDLSVPAETWFLIDLIDEFGLDAKLDRAGVDRAIEIVIHKKRWKNFNVPIDELASRLASSNNVGLADFFEAFMSLEIAPSGKSRWVDKTPEYVLHLADLARLFPTARFVEIRRDGRDVYQSLQKQRWRGRTPVRIGEYWAACIDAAGAASETLPPSRWLSVRYEDLVLDMETTTRSVCRFLDVPYDPRMLAFHHAAAENVPSHSIERGFHSKLLRPPEPSDVYKWKRNGSGWQGWLFEAMAAEQLRSSGYEVRVSGLMAGFLRPLAYLEHIFASAWVKLTKTRRAAATRPASGSSS